MHGPGNAIMQLVADRSMQVAVELTARELIK